MKNAGHPPSPRRKNIQGSLGVGLGTGIAALALMIGVWAAPLLRPPPPPRPPTTIAIDESPVRLNTYPATSYSNVVRQVAPGVVSIYTTRTVLNPLASEWFLPFYDPTFRQFFGDAPNGSGKTPPDRSEKQQSLGSGVIISADGHILTNNHVVEGADEIRVALAGESGDHPARLVGRDVRTDIAVLKIEASGLTPLTLADSSKVSVGDVVLAIGNPFGVGQTVTMGIISATGRSGLGIEEDEDFLQTDAAINPGNSGGALVDTEGRLTGICTAIISRNGGNQGVGFAVPINLARQVMEQILVHGHVVRGWLGVHIQDLTPELRKYFAIDGQPGVLVSGVAEGGPASAAGLLPGDAIVEFQGRPATDCRTLKLAISQTPPGTVAGLKILRNGRQQSLAVTLREMPEIPALPGPAPQPGGELLPGVASLDLDPETRRQFSLPDRIRGVLVTELDTNSPAHAAGLREGDVIQEINRQPVTSIREAAAALRTPSGARTMLRVWSRTGSRFVLLESSKKS